MTSNSAHESCGACAKLRSKISAVDQRASKWAIVKVLLSCKTFDYEIIPHLDEHSGELSQILDCKKHDEDDGDIENISFGVVVHGGYPIYGSGAADGDQENERHLNHGIRYAVGECLVLPILIMYKSIRDIRGQPGVEGRA